MILLDTHALLWWALDPEQLSSRAAQALQVMEENGGGFASSISIWELAIKVKRGHLELPITIEELSSRIDAGGVVTLLPVDTSTWLESTDLEWTHRDPADRVIVATARMRGLPLVTKDRFMHDFAGVDCLW